jgi:hypothetical protein
MMRVRGLPDEVRSRLTVDRGERPLAWATGPAGEWYVGTDRALHFVTPVSYQRLPWEGVENASWHAESQTLVVVEVADERQQATHHSLAVAEGGRLLELLRERVTKSVVHRQFEAVRGKSGVSVIARRSPVGNGRVAWSTVYAIGLNPSDPSVVAAVARARAKAEVELGERTEGLDDVR